MKNKKNIENVEKKENPKKPIKRGVKLLITYLIIICASIALATVIFVFVFKKGNSYVPPPPAVEIVKPEKRTIKQSVKISGYIEALDMIPVVPFVSGTIKDYPIKAGMKINKGDLIAKIDDEPYRQQFLQAQAGYLGVKSSFERIESLYKAGATTKQNYDSVKAQHDAVKAQYDLAALQLSYTNVTAPASGTILMAPMAVGSIGSNTQPLAVIADLTKLVVRLNVPEKYFDLFSSDAENLSAVIRRPGLEDFSEDTVCDATLETISPYIQPESKTFQVVFSLQDNLERFLPGMYIEVVVTYSTKDGILALPLKVLKVDGSCYIYESETQTVVWKDINSTIRDDSHFAISEKDGIDYTDTYFVITGQNAVFDGQKVTATEYDLTQDDKIEKTENEVLEESISIENSAEEAGDSAGTNPTAETGDSASNDSTKNDGGAL